MNKPRLHTFCGLIASGKSTLAKAIAEEAGVFRNTEPGRARPSSHPRSRRSCRGGQREELPFEPERRERTPP